MEVLVHLLSFKWLQSNLISSLIPSYELWFETDQDILVVVLGIPTTIDYHKLILDIQVSPWSFQSQ